MAADSKQNIKTLRVDNWAVFFLQRLQLMFAKGDCCDLTLKFHTGQELKVHRLVLITCTTFFENMQREGDVISMPEDLPYSVVQPIINFLYSGKLEFKSELHPQLLNISKSLNITILAKLLITQKNDNGLGPHPTLKSPENKKLPQRTFLATRIGPASNSGGMGARKLPIWRQRTFPLFRPDRSRVVIKDEEPRPMRFEWPEGKEPSDSALLMSPSFTPLSYKSEPVFTPANPPLLLGFDDSAPSLPESSLKRRAPPPTTLPEKFFKEDRKEDDLEVKKELPSELADFSDDDDGHFETIHSYDHSEDELEQESMVRSSQPVKPRTVTAPQPPPPLIRPSSQAPIIQTYQSRSQRQAVHQPSTPVQQSAASGGGAFEPIAESTPVAAPPPLLVSSSLPPKPILKPNTDPLMVQTPTKKVRFSIDDDDDSKTVTRAQPDPQPDMIKPLIKGLLPIQVESPSDIIYEAQAVSPSSNAQSLPTRSVVQHATTENDGVTDSSTAPTLASISAPAPSPAPLPTTFLSSPSKTGAIQTYSKTTHGRKVEKKLLSPADSSNHAKIIAEVLKKYPDLVRNNKNIKLKISAPGSSSITNTLTLDTKRSSGKAYVVVKSTVKTESPTTIKSESNPTSSTMVLSTKPVLPHTNPSESLVSPTSNAAPWNCSSCGKDGVAMKFSSYYEFRRHFQEVHNEKFDSRTCEYCGYKTSKRNLYLYHMFTKHNVAPPKSMSFPKCDQCGYIALSEGLLQKHVLTHKALKDWPCSRCETVFKTYNHLQAHSSSCKGTNNDLRFTCFSCRANFKTSIALNAHAKVCSVNSSVVHKESVPLENDVSPMYEESGPRPEQAVQMIEVPIMDGSLGGKAEHTYVQLPSGLILTDNPNVALLPAGEGEELTTVGNNIGGPLGLTVALPQDQHVILLDANSEFFIQGNDSMVVGQLNSGTEEYIVPEVLEEGMQHIYSTQGLNYSVATSTGNMMCPVVPMRSSAQLDKHEESGNTVVRVQDHVDSNELDNVHIQHHVDAGEIGSIIVHNTATNPNSVEQQTQSDDTQVDIYVEESHPPPPPQRHHMTINKELMEVVAMEVQRSPMIDSTPVVQAETTTLGSSQYDRATSTSAQPQLPNHSSTGSSQTEVMPASQPVATTMDGVRPEDTSSQVSTEKAGDEHTITIDDSDDGEKIAEQAAKAHSLVKDWGFDNEEESDAVEMLDGDDSDSEEEGARTGPSRVTVEL